MKTIIAAFTAIFLYVNLSNANEINIDGSYAVYSNIFSIKTDDIEKATGLSLNVKFSNSTKGIEDLIDNRIQIAMTSTPLAHLLSEVKNYTPDIQLTETQVGTSQVVFITNINNKINSLTDEQIKGILTGKYKKWSELGGDNQDILIVMEKTGGMRTTVEKEIISAPIQGNIKEVVGIKQQMSQVSKAANACTYINFEAITNSDVKLIKGNKEFHQKLYLVTKNGNDEAYKKIVGAINNPK